MTDCDDYYTNIQLYFDEEVSDKDLEEFRIHCKECATCEQAVEAERELSRILKGARPLYSAPDSLRKRILDLSPEPELLSPQTSAPSRFRFAIVTERFLRSLSSHRWQTWTTVAVLLIAIVLLLPEIRLRLLAPSYVEAAVATHRDLLDGNLPLQIGSDSPVALTKWFAGEVPFDFRLPTSTTASIHGTIYKPVGGRVVNYRGNTAAFVSYERQGEKVSLLVTSSKSAIAAGGEQVRSGGVVYHYVKRAGFNVATWSDRGLTYAAVSSLSDSGQQSSCLVCHQNLPDRSHFISHE